MVWFRCFFSFFTQVILRFHTNFLRCKIPINGENILNVFSSGFSRNFWTRSSRVFSSRGPNGKNVKTADILP